MGRAYIALLGLVLIGACNGKNDKPAGQVIATVNGDEITRAQLNAMLPKREVAKADDATKVRNALLDRLVVQELLAQEARRLELDKSQDYLIALHRAQSMILADLLTRQTVRNLDAPQPEKVKSLIHDNPWRFDKRVLFLVDEVRFPNQAFDIRKLADTHSLDAVIARLTEAKVPIETGRSAIDTATLDATTFNRLNTLPSGEPFIMQGPKYAVARAIRESQPAPLGPDAATPLAKSLLSRRETHEVLEKQIDGLRRNATIRYQSGFGPVLAPPPASGTR